MSRTTKTHTSTDQPINRTTDQSITQVADSLSDMDNSEGILSCLKSVQSPGNYLPTADDTKWGDEVTPSAKERERSHNPWPTPYAS